MTKQTRGSQQSVHMIHKERMENRCWQFDMTKMTRATEVRLAARYAAVQMLETFMGRYTTVVHTCLAYTRDPEQGHTSPQRWVYSSHREGQDS
jgi:hypothetical protein